MVYGKYHIEGRICIDYSVTKKPANKIAGFKTWRIPGSNRSPLTCHASALPDELIPLWPPKPPAKEVLLKSCKYINSERIPDALLNYLWYQDGWNTTQTGWIPLHQEKGSEWTNKQLDPLYEQYQPDFDFYVPDRYPDYYFPDDFQKTLTGFTQENNLKF